MPLWSDWEALFSPPLPLLLHRLLPGKADSHACTCCRISYILVEIQTWQRWPQTFGKWIKSWATGSLVVTLGSLLLDMLVLEVLVTFDSMVLELQNHKPPSNANHQRTVWWPRLLQNPWSWKSIGIVHLRLWLKKLEWNEWTKAGKRGSSSKMDADDGWWRWGRSRHPLSITHMTPPSKALGLILKEIAPPIKLCKNQYKRETWPPILLKQAFVTALASKFFGKVTWTFTTPIPHIIPSISKLGV